MSLPTATVSHTTGCASAPARVSSNAKTQSQEDAPRRYWARWRQPGLPYSPATSHAAGTPWGIGLYKRGSMC
jgi:hypothetical protein